MVETARIKLLDKNCWLTVFFRCKDGVMQLRFSKKPPSIYRKNPQLYGKKSVPIFKFKTQTESFITSDPLLMDPFDRSNIRIGASRIEGVTGDALIARRDIPAFEAVAYYAGVLVRDTSVSCSHLIKGIDKMDRLQTNKISKMNRIILMTIKIFMKQNRLVFCSSIWYLWVWEHWVLKCIQQEVPYGVLYWVFIPTRFLKIDRKYI